MPSELLPSADYFRGQIPDVAECTAALPTGEQVSTYHSPWLQDELIEEYLHVGSPGELAQLAAQFAPVEGKFNARQMVARAVELQKEAEHHLWLERTQLAFRMNRSTLLDLAARLKIDGLGRLNQSTSRTHWYDPITGPVAQCKNARDCWENQWMEHALELGEAEWDATENYAGYFSVENPKDALIAADARTSLKRPKLRSGTLLDALRWSTGDEKAPPDCLDRSFLDLLRSLPCNPWELFSCEDFDADTPEYKEALALRKFRKSFRPGSKVPEKAENDAYAAYDSYWGGGPSDTPLDESKLAWLSVKFHEFWRKHRKIYLDAARKLSDTKAKAAFEMHAKREMKWCLKQISHFFDHLGQSTIPQQAEEREEMFKKFGKDVAKIANSKRREELVDLLSTLHSRHGEDPKAVLEILQSSKSFKHLSEDGVAECMQLWCQRASGGTARNGRKKVRESI